jgi:hypothetical protein
MRLLIDSFWRAVFYALHPRVIALSFVPLLLVSVVTIGLYRFFWDDAYDSVRTTLEHWSLMKVALAPLTWMLGAKMQVFVIPLILVAIASPMIVAATLVLVALCVSPAAVEMVARRRFPTMERRHGGAWWKGFGWSLICTVGALVAIAATMPLWFVPGLILVVPPVIWGWLAARVMAFDAVSEHASAEERRALMNAHQWPLMVAGIVTGLLCNVPWLVWTLSWLTLALAPILVVVTIWLYTLILAFSALWFTHYMLAALHALRAAEQQVADAGAARRSMARVAANDVVDLEPLTQPPRDGDEHGGGVA